jgi:hypothetical protein
MSRTFQKTRSKEWFQYGAKGRSITQPLKINHNKTKTAELFQHDEGVTSGIRQRQIQLKVSK